MGSAHSLAELRAMPDDRLIQDHDAEARMASVGVSYYLEELFRRESARATAAMLEYTRTVKRLTWIITFLTLVAAVFATLAFFAR